MDAGLYMRILSDKSVLNLKKIRYKYPEADIGELIGLFKAGVYKTLPLLDFYANKLVFMESIMRIRTSSVKLLLTHRDYKSGFGLKAMENEIASTLAIENIDFSRDSVRKILKGFTPSDDQENRILGMKKGFEFISDPSNAITEQNIFTLYDMSIGQYLDAADRLIPGEYYRHDTVFVVGSDIEHIGLPSRKLPEYMKTLADFIAQDSPMDDLIKAAAIHYFFSYLHPYFDGNGRMARLLHLWYLHQQGYSSALFLPFSSHIEQSRRQYYNVFTLIEKNREISGILDITPFLLYTVEHVYNKLENAAPSSAIFDAFDDALKNGMVTLKEKELWNYVLSAYGTEEFSTKRLERDFGNAAYATIRGFVLKFSELGLLCPRKYGSRVRYGIQIDS